MMKFLGEEVVLVISTYLENGNFALLLQTPDGLPYAHISKNLKPLPKGYVYLDTNNYPGVEEFVADYELCEFVNAYGESGYCKYPLYKINMEICIDKWGAIRGKELKGGR